MGNFFESMSSWLEVRFLPLANKVSSQRHLLAVRDGFIATLPISMVGALVVMFLNVILGSETLIGEVLNRLTFYQNTIQPFINVTILPVFNQIWWGTLALGVIFSTFSISYHLANGYKEDGVSAGLTAIAMYLTLLPQQVEGADWGTISWVSFSSEAIFAGLLVAFFSTEVFCFVKRKGWVIKMPEQVPPAVSKAFSAMIPTAIVLLFAGSIATFFLNVVGEPLQQFINTMLQRPLVMLGQSPFTIIFIIFIQQVLWFFGLHGALIVGPALDMMYSPALAANAEAILIRGVEPTNAITRNLPDLYGMHGGSGATLALIVAIFIFSRKQGNRSLAKMSLAPGIFQINEPMIYGLPIVLNPIMAIPFIIVPPICVFIGWFFTAVIPFAGYVYIGPPWVTPPILSAFLATGGDIGATILSAVTFVLAIVIYAPFVLLANKEKDL